jgi:peptidoglycan biosynthesis protein MviN/MurJ (putative lipid II flippase)
MRADNSNDAANLVLSFHWGRPYALVGVALGTMVSMIVTALLIQPWRTLRLLKLPVGEYIQVILGWPLLASAAFLTLCHFIYGRPAPASFWSLVITVACQGCLLIVLACGVGLAASDREIVLRRCKELARLAPHWKSMLA